MLCCCEPLGVNFDEKAVDDEDDLALFPGQRRLVKTPGNALVAAPRHEEKLVSVTVPFGTSAGETIHVKSPDGVHTVSATVPEGMRSGQTFMVRVPHTASSNNTAEPVARASNTPSSSPIPFANVLGGLFPHSSNNAVVSSYQASDIEPVEASASQLDTSNNSSSVGSIAQKVDKLLTPKPDPPFKGQLQPGQKLLLVHVPSGVEAGSYIHVEVPNEGRVLAAQVPPNVTEFHIAYMPRPVAVPVASHSSSSAPLARASLAPLEHPVPAHATTVRQTTGKQNLLLVQVPTGVTAGSTLHVSVPNEPGRILSARVPPGNVSEFHVSYVPSDQYSSGFNSPVRGGMLRPASAYCPPPPRRTVVTHESSSVAVAESNQPPPQAYSTAQSEAPKSSRTTAQRTTTAAANQTPKSSNKGGGGGFGDWLFPFAAASALGAAGGVGLSQNVSGQQQEDDGYDATDEEPGGDADGAYVGDDFGGFDF